MKTIVRTALGLTLAAALATLTGCLWLDELLSPKQKPGGKGDPSLSVPPAPGRPATKAPAGKGGPVLWKIGPEPGHKVAVPSKAAPGPGHKAAVPGKGAPAAAGQGDPRMPIARPRLGELVAHATLPKRKPSGMTLGSLVKKHSRKDYETFSTKPIPAQLMQFTRLEARTGTGGTAEFHAYTDPPVVRLVHQLVLKPKYAHRFGAIVRQGASHDFETGAQSTRTRTTDFRWSETVGLIPQNGAKFRIAQALGRHCTDAISPADVQDAEIIAMTNSGNIAMFDAQVSGGLLIMHYVKTQDTDGKKLVGRDLQSVNDGYSYDLDAPGLSRTKTAGDFRWSKTQGLIPQNGARFLVTLDFRGITAKQVRSAKMTPQKGGALSGSLRKIDRKEGLEYLYFMRTDQGRIAKLTYHHISKGTIRILRLYTWKLDESGPIEWLRKPITMKQGDALDVDSGMLNTVDPADKPDLEIKSIWIAGFYWEPFLVTKNGAVLTWRTLLH